VTAAAAQRADAARLLERVTARGQTTDQAFGSVAQVTPLVHELVLGSLRHWWSLSRMVDTCLHKPLPEKDQDIRLLMVVGAYQLRHTRIPDHAAIHETVDACRVLRKPWACRLVNAVLRRCAARSQLKNEQSFEMPDWLEAALRADYADAEDVMLASLARAPMSVRINRLRIDPEAWAALASAAGITLLPTGSGHGASGWGPETRTLAEPVSARDLPGFAEGLVSIQDAGAQCAAPLLEPEPGQRVLDACAAPGGKLFHLLEREPQASYLGIDQSERRIAWVQHEAERLGHHAVALAIADATGLDWWDGEPFQRILLDAPCTGTGTLRRHPDIKLLRRQEDVAAAADLQTRLLANLWRVLAPGGRLVYCTCSLLTAENDAVLDRFLAGHPDARIEPITLASGRPMRHGWQLLPTDPLTDGFYYSRVRKVAA
jgi:16S rRNA (cytosine967-C5)-methyltransferase